MNYYERHIGDYLKDTAHLSLLEHGVYTRLLDVYYTREAALPDSDVARLIGARSKDERAAMRTVLEEFFRLVDGAWVQRRCEQEIERFLAKKPEADARKESTRERQRRTREHRKQIFDALREHGITPAWNATTKELHQHLSRVTSHAGHAPVTRDESPPVTRDATASHSPDTNSVPNGTGVPPPVTQFAEPPKNDGFEPDPVKDLFDLGVAILTRAGRTEREARSLIGRLRKDRTDEEAASILVSAKSSTDPAAYIAKAMQPKPRRVQLC